MNLGAKDPLARAALRAALGLTLFAWAPDASASDPKPPEGEALQGEALPDEAPPGEALQGGALQGGALKGEASQGADPEVVKMRLIQREEFARFIVSGTSNVPREGGAYDARALTDGRLWSAWGSDEVEDVWIEIHFDTPRYVARIQFMGGDGASTAAWRRSRRPRAFVIVHDHGQRHVPLGDAMSLQTLEFPEAIVTSRLQLKMVDGAYGGGLARAPMTISELMLYEPENVFALKPDLRQEIQALVEALRDPERRDLASTHLLALGEPARPWILTALKERDPRLRAAAVELLLRARDRKAIDPIHAAAEEVVARPDAAADPDERAFMVAALRFFGQMHAVKGARLARKMLHLPPWREAMEGQLVEALAQSGLPETAPVLIDAMRSENPALVAAAIPAFAHLGAAGTFGMNTLGRDEDPAVRARVAQAFAHFSRPRPLPLIRKLLEDREPAVRAQMLRSLGESAHGDLLPMILAHTSDPSTAPRLSAAEALGRVPREDAALALVALTRDRSPRVRSAAVKALEQHAQHALPHLVALAPPGAGLPEDVTQAVERALVRLAQRHESALSALLLEPLPSMAPADGQHFAYLLAACGTTGASALLAMIESDNTRLAFYAMRALQRRPDFALAAIEARVNQKDFDSLDTSLIARYIQIIASSGDPAWVPTLTRIAKDPRKYLRAEAIRALGYFDAPQANAALIDGLSDEWEDVRFEAVNGLGAHKVTEAVPALIGMIDHHDTRTLPAIRALGDIGDPRALPALYRLLEHDRSTVRQYACTAIGAIGQPESLSHLLAVINDKDELVAFYAQRAMRQIK